MQARHLPRAGYALGVAFSPKLGREYLWGTALGAVALVLVAGLSRVGLFQAAEEQAQAALLSGRAAPFSPEVVLVENDEQSYVQLGYPFTRASQARLLEAITAAGPKAVGIDAIFAPHGVDGEAGDQAFAHALQESPHAVLALACAVDSGRSPEVISQTLAGSAVPMGETPALGCRSALPPYPPLAGSAKLGHIQLAASHSNANLGLYAFVDVGTQRIPTLALQLYLEGKGLDRSALQQAPDGVRVGERFLHTTHYGEVLIAPHDPEKLHRLSMLDLQRAIGTSSPPRLPATLARELAGRYVLIGNTAIQMNDLGYSPTGELIPLVLMHASLLSDLLEGTTPRPAPRWLSLLLLFGLGGLAIAAALATRPRVAARSVAVIAFGLFGGSLLLLRHGVLIAPLQPLVGVVLAFAAALGSRMVVRERERGILRGAFESYVDPDHLQRILDQPSRFLSLGGARKELTILFSDIQGYTGLSNALPPEEVISLLREYLGAMTHRVRERGGRVDKIMGDGIMAVFGDPVANQDHALAAVEVALDMQRSLTALRKRWAASGKAELAIRIGIATGEVFVGNIGSPGAKMEYTALGPTVNLASRLEGRAPAGGILVSAATRDACQAHFDFEAVPGLTLKGFAEPYQAYRVLGVRLSSARRA